MLLSRHLVTLLILLGAIVAVVVMAARRRPSPQSANLTVGAAGALNSGASADAGASTSYLGSSLIDDEHVIYQAKISLGKLFWPALLNLLFVWTVILEIIVLPWLLLSIVYVTSTEIAVTNRKVLAKWGVLRRITVDQRLDKIDSVSIDQGILGGILGYGNVTIAGSGMTLITLAFVADPMSLKRAIEQAVAQPPGSPRPGSGS